MFFKSSAILPYIEVVFTNITNKTLQILLFFVVHIGWPNWIQGGLGGCFDND